MKVHLFGEGKTQLDIDPEETVIVLEFAGETERDTHARNLGDMVPGHLFYGIFPGVLSADRCQEILDELKARRE